MKNVFCGRLVSCVLVALPLALAAAVPSGYVTEGLTACWDGIDNLANGFHSTRAVVWRDLVGRQVFTLSSTTWDGNALNFNGSGYATLSGEKALALFGYDEAADDTNRTVEIVFKYNDATADGFLLVGQTASNIALARDGSKMVYSIAKNEKAGEVYPSDAFWTVSAAYSKGTVQEGSTRQTNAVVTLTKTSDFAGASKADSISIGKSLNWSSRKFAGRIYAIRVYNRHLTAAEAAQNYQVDHARFDPQFAATVVSGSVTVGGVTYGADEKIFAAPGETTLAITSATDAEITLTGRLTALSLADGTLKLSDVATEDYIPLTVLTLGATANLQLPAEGINVSSTLTADTGATVTGPGELVAAAATSPVTLAGGATYRSSTASGAFTWPSSGVAYIPAATTVDIDDVSKVAAVDKIVFLADSSKLTYKLADAWTLAKPVEGPGTFAFESAGDITISSDNANLTGAFFFSNTTVLVTHENGLGSTRAGLCDFYCGDTTTAMPYGHTLDFDNGETVFTNRVSVRMYPLAGKNVTFGSYSLDKTLVHEADFINQRLVNASLSPYFKNHVRFPGHVQINNGSSHFWMNGTVADAKKGTPGGSIYFLGSVYNSVGSWYTSSGNYYMCFDANFSTRSFRFYAGVNWYCLKERMIAPYFTVNPYANGALIDLGGFDQETSLLERQSMGQTTSGTPIIRVASAKPAALRFTGANSWNVNPTFSGASGFTMAGSGTYGFYNQSGESVNDTTGELKVESGTLVLADSYTWSGTNVTVTGGALKMSNTQGIASDKAHLTVTGGTLALQAGASALVGYATFGTTNLLDDTYTKAMLLAIPEVAPYIGDDWDDDAKLTVSTPAEFEWEGWPETPTDVVRVPGSKTVYVGADETNKIALYTRSINLGVNAKVIFTNMPNAAIDWTIPLSGKGVFTFDNCGTVTLSCDNSALKSPGAFAFNKTSVIVNHRYGLGGAETATCNHSCERGSKQPGNTFLFTENAKTNDVSIIVDEVFFFGCTPETGSLVQNGDFTQTGGIRTNRSQLYGNLTFTGVMKSFAFDDNSNTILHFAETSVVKGSSGSYSFYGAPGPKSITYDAPVPAANANELVLQGGFEIYLNADYAFDLQWLDGTPPKGGLQVHDGGTIYLNGHDQRVARLIGNQSYLTDTKNLIFTSDEPATLYIEIRDFKDRTTQETVNGKTFSVTGAVSLVFEESSLSSRTKSYTQHMGFGRNDTTGSLIVRTGTFDLARGAYWGGTNVIVEAGTLQISQDCRAASAGGFFGRKTGLVMETGAALDIGTNRVDTVRTFKLAGAYQSAGTYCGANTPACDRPAGVHVIDALTGQGVLRVRRSTDQEGFLFTIR